MRFQTIFILGFAVLCGSPQLAFAKGRQEPTAPKDDPHPVSLGARYFSMPETGRYGAQGFGLEASLSIRPFLAAGMAYSYLLVDQGDSACESSCLDRVRTLPFQFFAEGRLWPLAWVTPYGRFGMGTSEVHGLLREGKSIADLYFSMVFEAGVELHYWISSRLFAFQPVIVNSPVNEKQTVAYGLQLGARF